MWVRQKSATNSAGVASSRVVNLGILISDSTEGVVPHKRVELDARAAYEILLYYTQAYFWYWIPHRWGPPGSTPWRSIWM